MHFAATARGASYGNSRAPLGKALAVTLRSTALNWLKAHLHQAREVGCGSAAVPSTLLTWWVLTSMFHHANCGTPCGFSDIASKAEELKENRNKSHDWAILWQLRSRSILTCYCEITPHANSCSWKGRLFRPVKLITWEDPSCQWNAQRKHVHFLLLLHKSAIESRLQMFRIIW